MNYQEFIKNKSFSIPDAGFDIDRDSINPLLFDWQKDIVKYAIKKGKCCLFTMTGTGKTIMQLEFGRIIHEKTGDDVLILAPLAVSHQTEREAKKLSLPIKVCECQEDVIPGINITNYEKLHRFDASKFGCIILDESSILKAQTGKYRNFIIDSFRKTPFKLACSATPAPNDFMELGNHCEFMGVMSYHEMLSMFFIHDGSDTAKWRLKKHGQDEFWKWLAEWSILLTKPSDLGYDDDGFILPKLNIYEDVIPSGKPTDGYLFPLVANTLRERQEARRSSTDIRTDRCAEIVNASDEIFLIWCNMNYESELLTKKIHGAVEIRGSHKDEYKTKTMLDFAEGEVRVLISKPKISGFGMNFQVCHNMAFVGLSDSFEQYFQAVRRCWRFGQKQEVNVHIITSELEGNVVSNIKRKEQNAELLMRELVKHTKHITSKNIKETKKEITVYNPTETMKLPEWCYECA